MISGWDEFSKMGIDGRLGINQTQDDFGVMPHQLVCQVNPGFFSEFTRVNCTSPIKTVEDHHKPTSHHTTPGELINHLSANLFSQY